MVKIVRMLFVSLIAASIMAGSGFGPGLGSSIAQAESVASTNEIKVLLDGSEMSFQPAPVQEKGVTLVPMRPIFQALGAQLTWEKSTQTVIARSYTTTITLKVGSKTAVVNGKNIPLDVPVKLENGTTFVPLRLVSEALGAKIKWTQATHTIEITSFEEQQRQLWDSYEAMPEEPRFTAEDIVALNDNKIVMISTNRSQGSGVIIGDRLILTNLHVMSGATTGTVATWDGRSVNIAGVVVHDQLSDLAIIQTTGALNASPVLIGDSYYLNKGARVIALGSPLGQQNTVSEGLLSNFYYEDDVEYLQFNAPIDHGSSGGALFNEYGELIGITTSKIEGSSANLNFAISTYNVEQLLEELELLMDSGELKAAFLPSSLPESLSNATMDEISQLMKDNFSGISTVEGSTSLTNWKASRDAQGWIVITANIEPAFYMYYSESISKNLRLWSVNAVSELKRMLPEQKIELIVYYEQTFSYEPRGMASGEVSSLGNGKWRVRYPVIHAQVQDRAHIEIRK